MIYNMIYFIDTMTFWYIHLFSIKQKIFDSYLNELKVGGVERMRGRKRVKNFDVFLMFF